MLLVTETPVKNSTFMWQKLHLPGSLQTTINYRSLEKGNVITSKSKNVSLKFILEYFCLKKTLSVISNMVMTSPFSQDCRYFEWMKNDHFSKKFGYADVSKFPKHLKFL